MMKNLKNILTADIGSCCLKIAEFQYTENKLHLEFFDYIEYAANINEESRIEHLQSAVDAMMQKQKFKSKKIYMSISGQYVFTKFSKLPAIKNKNQKIQQIIQYEAKQNIPSAIDEVTWDYQLLGNPENTEEGINILFAAIKNEIISDTINVFESAGFETVFVGIAPIATYNCIKGTKIIEEEPSVILNIGAKCTSIIFVDKDNFYLKTVPIGGYHVTQEIAKDLNIDFNGADSIKKTHGYIHMDSSLEQTEDSNITHAARAVRNVMLKLHGEIMRAINIYRSQQNGKKPEKIYITGGSSTLTYLTNFLEDKFEIPVRHLNPLRVIYVNERVDKQQIEAVPHVFTELIGLALGAIAESPLKISLMPESLKKIRIIRQKAPYFYIAIAISLCTLSIVLWGVVTQKKIIDNLIVITEQQSKKTMDEVEKTKKLKDQLQSVVNEYADVSKMIANRNSWFDLLNEIEKCLPDNTWIVEFDPSDKPEQVQKETGEEPQNVKTLFGRRQIVYQKQPAEDKNIVGTSWIKIKAHTLTMFSESKKTEAELFKENLLTSPFFTKNPQEIVILDYRTQDNPSNNIDTFIILIRLNKTIPD